MCFVGRFFCGKILSFSSIERLPIFYRFCKSITCLFVFLNLVVSLKIKFCFQKFEPLPVNNNLYIMLYLYHQWEPSLNRFVAKTWFVGRFLCSWKCNKLEEAFYLIIIAGNRTNHFEVDNETAYQIGYPKNGWLENDRLIIDKNNLIRKRQLQILECCKDCSCAKNVAQEQIFNS